MTGSAPREAGDQRHVRVRYWAAAREAAGVAHDDLSLPGPVSLADVRAAVLVVRGPHVDERRLRRVLGVCSVLVGDRPVASADPVDVVVAPGEDVQFLPPFAGG